MPKSAQSQLDGNVSQGVRYKYDDVDDADDRQLPGSAGRQQKRVLVRWNDDIDKQLLLVVQWACTEAGIKIPWDRIAGMMGPYFSDGACVQHLAKLRLKMDANGIAVPPPLRRGAIVRSASAIYGNNPAPLGAIPFVLYPPKETKKPAQKRVFAAARAANDGDNKGKAKAKGRGRMIKEEDSDDEPKIPEVLYDSDDDYGMPKKKRARNNKVKPEVDSAEPKVKLEGEDVANGPRTRTGRKDYAKMQNAVSDEEYEGIVDDVEAGACHDFPGETQSAGSTKSIHSQNLHDHIIEHLSVHDVRPVLEPLDTGVGMQYAGHQMTTGPMNAGPMFADVQWDNNNHAGSAFTGMGMGMEHLNFAMMPPITPYHQTVSNSSYLTPRNSVSTRKDSTMTTTSGTQMPATPITPITPGSGMISGFGQLDLSSQNSQAYEQNFDFAQNIEYFQAAQEHPYSGNELFDVHGTLAGSDGAFLAHNNNNNNNNTFDVFMNQEYLMNPEHTELDFTMFGGS